MPLRSTDVAPLAPVLGLRQDGVVGTSSASDLLITVFGELMRPAGGSAWTQTLVAALGLLDVDDKAARQAISRLGAKGWMTSERIGRKSRWQLTEWATDLLVQGAERIYGLGADDRPWKGEWLVLLASVPETHRPLRSRLAVQLGWAGFGSLGQGVWVSPRIEREPEAATIVSNLDVDNAVLFRSAMTDIGSPLDLAERAWPPAPLASRYEVFLSQLDTPAMRDNTTTTRRLLELVDTWRRFPLIDPDLPLELRPADWPGDRAAQEFARRRSAWAGRGADWWTAMESSFG